jgi:RimJ/RimL family protein N-acetyltransferase
MSQLGGTTAQGGRTQDLKVDQVERNLLRSWQERARERAATFELGVWEGTFPEESLEEVAAMLEAANLQPRGDIDMEDFHFTPDQVREMDANMLARGLEHWTMYARDLDTGEIAGFTDVVWNPNQPDLLNQSGTMVFERYQNRGLGRWLKAAMLEKVLKERPEVTRIHTSNAHSNAPMLHINDELGFQPYVSTTQWQVELDKATSYVESKLGAHVSQG